MSVSYTNLFYKGELISSLNSAKHIVPLVMKQLQPKSVIDVGCGAGAFLKVFQDYGVGRIVGVDGDYVPKEMLCIPQENFVAADLTKPLGLDERFDLALCLEVGEHLPPDCAAGLVTTLTSLAPAVLFSAAVPSQCGSHHVNEQWQQFWAGLFNEQGYDPYDTIRWRVWNNNEVDFWYSQNMLLYVSRHAAQKVESLDAELTIPLDVVHPRLFPSWSDPGTITIRKYWKTAALLPYALKNSFYFRLASFFK
jgi:SAM-dependent methyltransferase